MVVLSSHEDAPAWAQIYQYVRDLGIDPEYNMGDGATAITKAGEETLPKSKRLMCWSHVNRNVDSQLKPIRTRDKTVAKQICDDLDDLQWMVLNERSFYYVFHLLEEKYLNKYDDTLNKLLKTFFDYMHAIAFFSL